MIHAQKETHWGAVVKGRAERSWCVQIPQDGSSAETAGQWKDGRRLWR